MKEHQMKIKAKSSGTNRNRCKTSLQNGDTPFLQEWLAAGQPPEQLSISAVCNASCLFCSNRMNPFPIRKNVFRDIDDVKLQLSLCSANYDGAIHMSDSLPGRISEGEAFLHPRFFEILALVREKFLTNVLHFTTNASLLDEAYIRKLAPFRPIEINVSLHSTRPELWARIFRRPQKRAHTALHSLGLMKKHRIDFTGNIVPLPRICGWQDIGETFSFLVEEGAKSVILWWPGFSDRTPAGLKKEILCPWDEFEDFVSHMRKTYPGFPIVPQPNLLEPRTLPIRRIMNFTRLGNLKAFGGAFHQVLWLVSEAAYPEIAGLVAQSAPHVPNEHHVFPVKNRTYGGNIRVSGLLMVSDFLAAGKEALNRWPDIDLVLVPRTSFDALFCDLQKTPACKIPETLGRTTWLVFEKGSFISLKGRGFFRPENDIRKTLEKMVKVMDESIRTGKHGVPSAMVAAFPIHTSAGMLKADEFVDFLKKAHSSFSSGADFEKRTFEKLGADRVLCIEEWPTADPSSPFSRWVFFRKMGKDWRLEMIFVAHDSIDIESR